MNENIKEILDNLKDIDKTSILKNNDAKIILDYIANLQEKYDKALGDSVKETHKLMAIRKYLKDNEREYGSLEDNEKIILGIIEGK